MNVSSPLKHAGYIKGTVILHREAASEAGVKARSPLCVERARSLNLDLGRFFLCSRDKAGVPGAKAAKHGSTRRTGSLRVSG